MLERATDVQVREADREDLLWIARIEDACFDQPWPFATFETYLDEPAFLVVDRDVTAGPDRGSSGQPRDVAVDDVSGGDVPVDDVSGVGLTGAAVDELLTADPDDLAFDEGDDLAVDADQDRLGSDDLAPDVHDLDPVARDEAVVGFVVADVTPNYGRDVGHVKDLAVHPDHRERGIGRLLLRSALVRLRWEDASVVKLEVRSGNEPARELYRSEGFEPLRQIPGYYSDGEAAVVMVLQLDEWASR